MNAFFATTRLHFKIVYFIKKNDEKETMLDHWYSLLFCLNWIENIFAYGVYRCYFFIYLLQDLFTANLSSYVALAATILYKLSSWLNRNA